MFQHKLQKRHGFGDCVIYSLVNLGLGNYKLIQDEIRELKHDLAKNIFRTSYRDYYRKYGYGTPEFFIPGFLEMRGIAFEKIDKVCKNFHGVVLTLSDSLEKHAAACKQNLVFDSHHENPIPVKQYKCENIGNYFIDPKFNCEKVSRINDERRELLSNRLNKLQFV